MDLPESPTDTLYSVHLKLNPLPFPLPGLLLFLHSLFQQYLSLCFFKGLSARITKCGWEDCALREDQGGDGNLNHILGNHVVWCTAGFPQRKGCLRFTCPKIASTCLAFHHILQVHVPNLHKDVLQHAVARVSTYDDLPTTSLCSECPEFSPTSYSFFILQGHPEISLLPGSVPGTPSPQSRLF